MKKKALIKYFKKEWKLMKSYLQSFLKKEEHEDLHQFRIRVKRIVAFIMLLDQLHHHTKLAKCFKPVKKLFKQAGVLRNDYISHSLIKEQFSANRSHKKFSAESIKINLFSECKLPGRFLITTSVGIGPILLAAVPDPYPYQGRPYDYCSGAELSISGEVNFARRFFYSLTYNGAWLKTLNGNSTEYLLHTLTSACRYRFIKEFSIGAEPGYLIVKNHFKNGISNYKTYPYFRIFFRYGVEL